jgi:hypothetical protein
MEYFIREMNSKRMMKSFNDHEMKNYQFLDEPAKKQHENTSIEIFKVLVYQGNIDHFMNDIEDYFSKLNNKIRKYIK